MIVTANIVHLSAQRNDSQIFNFYTNNTRCRLKRSGNLPRVTASPEGGRSAVTTDTAKYDSSRLTTAMLTAAILCSQSMIYKNTIKNSQKTTIRRMTAIEVDTQRLWTSRFLLRCSPNLELLYLSLSESHQVDSLRRHLKKHYFTWPLFSHHLTTAPSYSFIKIILSERKSEVQNVQ